MQLTSSAKLPDPPAIALVWPARRQLLELPQRLPFGSSLHALFAAFFGFAVQGLRHRCRTTHLTELKNLNLKDAALIGHLEHVAEADIARRFDGLTIGLDPSQIAGA